MKKQRTVPENDGGKYMNKKQEQQSKPMTCEFCKRVAVYESVVTVEPGPYAILYHVDGEAIGLIKGDRNKCHIRFYCAKHVPKLEPTKILWVEETEAAKCASDNRSKAIPKTDTNIRVSSTEKDLSQAHVARESITPQQVFDTALKQWVANRGGNQTDYARVRQKAVYVAIPSNESYARFIKVYQDRLCELYPQYSVETEHNRRAAAISTSEVYFPKTHYRGVVKICAFSDNENFTLMDGENAVVSVTFHPFGPNRVELSRIFVHPDYRNGGVGTALVKLSQNVVKELNAKLALYPAPPLAAEVIDPPAESERLRKWYIKLGFANCDPEMFNGFRLINNDPILFGWCGLMAFE